MHKSGNPICRSHLHPLGAEATAGQLGATVLLVARSFFGRDLEEQKEFLDRVMVALSRRAQRQMEGCNALIAVHGLSSRD